MQGDTHDPLALAYHPCGGGCGTTLACSPYAGPIRPPLLCVRCTAGKPAWPKDPPSFPTLGEEQYLTYLASYFLRKHSLPWRLLWRASDWLHSWFMTGEAVYLRDADGIPLAGQVEPLDLDAYRARYHPLDVHTVVTMLVEFAVRCGDGELAWQLLRSASAEHRNDPRLPGVAAAWLVRLLKISQPRRDDMEGKLCDLIELRNFSAVSAIASTASLTNLFREGYAPGNQPGGGPHAPVIGLQPVLAQDVSLVHLLSGEGNVQGLRSLKMVGVPPWKMLVTPSSLGHFPLVYALSRTPPGLPAVFDFFMRAADTLSGYFLTPQMQEAASTLPLVLRRALVWGCRKGQPNIVSALLAHPAVDPTMDPRSLFEEASGHPEVLAVLRKDARLVAFAPPVVVAPLVHLAATVVPFPAPHHNVFNQCGVGGCTVHKSRCTKHKVTG